MVASISASPSRTQAQASGRSVRGQWGLCPGSSEFCKFPESVVDAGLPGPAVDISPCGVTFVFPPLTCQAE